MSDDLLTQELFSIDLTELLSDARRELRGKLELEISDELASEYDVREGFTISAEYRLRKDREKLLLHLKISADVPLTCDRCLSDYVLRVEDEIDEVFLDSLDFSQRYETYRGGTRTLKEEDLLTFEYYGDTIDLGRVALEELIVRLPSKRLCREDCKGLCPVCGANRNEVDCGHEGQEVKVYGVLDPHVLREIEQILRKGGE